MFVIVATKPLDDGSQGFRFNLFGKKGLIRKRKNTSRGWFKRQKLASSNAYHFGRRTVYFFGNGTKPRKLYHFAG